MKKTFVIIAVLAMSTGLFAQTQDSLLRRQMELEREFNPTLMDADKINTLPALREPTVQKANTNYSTWAGRVTPPIEIALPQPGNIMTDIPFSTNKGYLFFNAGNYANLNGAFGYRLVDNDKHNLSFNFLHNSTNGDISYLQESVDGVGNNSNTAYMMDNLGKLSYLHLAESLKLNMQLSYLNSKFNYYGNPFEHERYFDNEKNSYGLLNAKVEVESAESDFLNYRGSIDFKNFTTKQSETPQYDWMKGNQIHAMVGLDKPFRGNSKVGVDGTLITALYNGDVDNYFLINAAPYILFGSNNTHAKLGVDVLFQNAENSKIRVVPNVELKWGVTERSSIYAKLHGGFKHNTLPDIMEETRYFLTSNPVRESFTHIDLEAGTKIGELSGFRFDIFGGYKKTEDEHFLVLNGRDIIDEGTNGPFMETLKPIYGTLTHSYIGGMINSNIWSPLNISIRLKKNFYDVDELSNNGIDITDAKAYNQSGIDLDIRGTLELIENMKLTLNYY
ncbi:MAG TPA: hypothetical protein VKX35_06095, partial [Fermentimonas sp.]|nr:hypothetical protein [Fermentimonas sp.]